MHFKALKEADLDALLDIYTHLHATDDSLPEREHVRALWDEVLRSPYFNDFGAFEGDQLIASCTISIIPNFTRGCRPYGVIENVVTHARFRKQGIGKGILLHALGFGWSLNCYKVMLMTGRKDEATFQFYEGAGFDRFAKQAFVALGHSKVSLIDVCLL